MTWRCVISNFIFSFNCDSTPLYRYRKNQCCLFYCLQDLTSELNDLEGKIFDAYIEQKADPLIAYVEPGMTICDFKWHNCLPPKGKHLLGAILFWSGRLSCTNDPILAVFSCVFREVLILLCEFALLRWIFFVSYCRCSKLCEGGSNEPCYCACAGKYDQWRITGRSSQVIASLFQAFR